jgi:regulator of cell morphogenesis and NO signaling
MAHECSCDHGSPMVLDVREMAPRETEIGTAEAPIGAEQTVGEVAHHRAGALEVMKEMGINHCCGAQLTLREAAASAGVPLDTLLTALNEVGKAPA